MKPYVPKSPPAAGAIAPGGKNATPIHSAGLGKLPGHTRLVRRVALPEERRRSQRVLLRVRANIHVALQGKATTFEAATLSVNPHGALVVMEQSLPLETSVVLEHAGTRERVAAKVIRPPQAMPEGFHIPLEFDSPAPGFWKIDFPPADWRPDDA